jgi:GYF domain 2
MADRSWFYASEGKQEGPFPEVQFRDLIARGTVKADTLVWSEAMSGWTTAGNIPGLLPNARGTAEPLDQAAAGLDFSGTRDDPSLKIVPADRMPELEVRLGRLLRISWLITWRTVLGSVLIGFVLGFIIGFVLGALGGTLTQVKAICGAVGIVGGLIWSLVCLKMALEKKYRDFRIALVPCEVELS